MAGRIIVGIDGSQQSAHALEWAVARARLGGQEVHLLNSYVVVPQVDFYSFHGPASSQPVDWLMEFSEHVLAAAETRVKELAPDVTCVVTSMAGHPAQALAAASESAAALVVGRRGLGGAASVVLGSVSNRLATGTKCPLIVVGGGEPPVRGPIAVGVDDSDYGVNALRYAISEAELRGTSVRAVTAFDVLHPAIDADPERGARLRAQLEAETSDTIARVVDEMAAAGLAPVKVDHVAVQGEAAEAILSHSHDAQLVVVGTHGKGLVRRVLLGSVSRRVLNDADRPVAVVDLPATWSAADEGAHG
jgi:nucleotide-binding universal stress UspA family protein